MAMGEIDESMIAESIATFTEFFTPNIDLFVNPKSSGPKVMGGTFAEAMDVCGQIWLGFKNTSVANKSFVAKCDGAIEVTQVYQHHLTDASGAEVAGTALTSQVVQTMTYTDDGKISAWVQEFDVSKVQAARKAQIMSLCKDPRAQANLAKCKETFDMQKQMAMGALTEAKFAEFTTKFAGDFAPCVEYAANPKTAGPKVTGTYEQVMQTIAPIWLGFKITRIENTSFAIKAENVIVVSQVYDNHLIDASGVEIPGTANKAMEVTQTVTYDADGKIKAWVNDYDAEKIQSSRNMAACRETFEIQVKM